ncbi:MAG: RNA polymerase sigma factor [Eubacteriales bacterium]|nr:RNA polymerase sigma factor [Eubacteriales bacterium]
MLVFFMSFLIDDEKHRRLFKEIYINYRNQMFLVARSVLANESDAEDIVHDVFLKIAQKHMPRISKIEKDIDLRNYLLKATKNTALDHLRKQKYERHWVEEQKRHESFYMSDATFIEKICSREEYDKIVLAILEMKDIYRDVLYYHFVMELSVNDVAKLMNCKVSTVKQRLVRGKKLLYEQLFGGGKK